MPIDHPLIRRYTFIINRKDVGNLYSSLTLGTQALALPLCSRISNASQPTPMNIIHELLSTYTTGEDRYNTPNVNASSSPLQNIDSNLRDLSNSEDNVS